MAVRNALARGAFALLLAVTTHVVTADDPRVNREFAVQLWDALRGLPHNSVASIAQTRDGYLWLGTYGGVARFDGVKFDLFNSRTNPKDFDDNIVQTLFADSLGRLWIGTGTGGVIVMEEGKFHRLTTRDGLPSDAIWSLAERDGTMIVGTQEGLAAVRNGKVSIDGFGAFAGRAIWSLLPEADGSLWIGCENDGLVELDATGRQTSFTTANGLPSNGIRTILRDRRGTLWIGTDSGLARLTDGRVEKVEDWELESSSIRALAEDGDSLWIGTFDGLGRLRNGSITAYRYENGLPSDTIRATFVDREGALWLGTGGGGLMSVKPALVRTFDRSDGLRDDVTRVILEAKDGTIWIGTYGGGLTQIRGSERKTFTTAEGLPADFVFSLAEDRDGAIWVGTRHGVARIVNGKVVRFASVPGVDGRQIRAIFTARDGSVYIGNPRGELTRYADGSFTPVNLGGRTNIAAIFFITETRDGSIWVATHGSGLFRLKDGRARLFDVASGFPTDRPWSLLEDSDGSLWIGTRGSGLLHLRGETTSVIDSAHGLYDDVVYHVLDDGMGRLWMSSNRGIFFVWKREIADLIAGRIPEVHSVPFGRGEGMQNTECNGGSQPAGWRMANGEIWFPTLRGAAIVDPRQVIPDPRPPSVIIEGVDVDGEPRLERGGFRISSANRRLEIRFTGMSLASPERVEFRYRLVGYDERWVARRERKASYSRLEPGTYTFEVSAASREGVWSDEPARVTIVVEPQWHERPAVRATLVVLFLLFGIAIYLGRVRGLRRRQHELETQVREQTHELREANSRLEDISRVDSLTRLANRRAFDTVLEREWGRCQRDGATIALVFVDVDHFKSYNDTRGHQQGDEALRRVAEVLHKAGRRPTDVVARYGGEEFAIVLSGTDAASALAIAGELRADVEALSIPHGGQSDTPVLTISIGVAAMVPSTGADAITLVENADKALYRAKRSGRNRVAET
ncbi:MAG: diguanylate cyclase [Acidobacteria bacterium]|nr:diguanylate cyclase [Acidobacteriota bacterium]